jgi:nucleotidyltransferase/DNA polymerase involved in DNA repair
MSEQFRNILHVDMDAFFAAIEQRERPELFGKPVIIGADPKQGRGRGVVSTCSYEARKFGVHSAMPISQAYKLCPQGIYIPPNGQLYTQTSKEIFKLFYEFTDLVEPLSIDEAFLDISGSIKLLGPPEKIAKKLKYRIYQEQALTASVGIAPNKFLAKIASDLDKPDGLVVVDPHKVDAFLHPLPLTRLWGAGQKTIEKLNRDGLRTIGDLAKLPRDLLEKKYGKIGTHFYFLSHGIDDRAVVPGHAVKSVSNEVTFDEDLSDLDQLHKTLLRLSEKVAYRLRQQHLQGKTVHLKLRYEGFETHTRNKTLVAPTANTEQIYHVILDLFTKNYDQARKVRLLGVGISGFAEKSAIQLSLFDPVNPVRSKLDDLEDIVRKKFGKNAISRAEGMKKTQDDERWFE